MTPTVKKLSAQEMDVMNINRQSDHLKESVSSLQLLYELGRTVKVIIDLCALSSVCQPHLRDLRVNGFSFAFVKSL